MNKKKKVLIIVGIILLILIVLIVFLLLKGNNKPKKVKEIKPYIEEKSIKIESAKDEISIQYSPYARDKNKTPIDADGVVFEKTKGTYKFYDYKVGEEDENGYVTYSYKYDLVVPITYTIDTSKNSLNNGWSRSYAFLGANVFDYYTGELYREKNESITGNITYRDLINPTDEDMQYTDITWNKKTYKIGVRNEISSKWDGNHQVSSNNGIDTYSDTNRVSVITYIYAPKDYDGLVISLSKKGTSKDMVLKQIEENNKYNNLLKEYETTGEKSKELEEYEKNLNRVYKLLDSRYFDSKRTKDDFYVIRVNDIIK